ncbi:hypothetical protein ASG01_00030 [Chryseobacterium sp. Leaf180]|uniref:hypothetical protein n=1 Tax=Chryseobacterium sp. Leaf180 TaxID=1736289 RepID=UPI0006F25DFD|nr:hypothetical protein [Chryseobacterium sp. Leaf180]KQR94317.1 hypothetical protein ASG01_00030 [Chryseobacterium sp. Leaf180]
MVKQLQILNLIALLATVGINYLSNTGIINDETVGSVSADYRNLFTPAGYAFSIWGLIYTLLLGFAIYYGPFTKNTDLKEKTVLNIGWWFIVSCLANSMWIFTWLNGYLFLTIPVMIVLLISLLKIILNNHEIIESRDLKTTLFLRLPFYIYSGWISVALIADIATYLKKIEWDGFGISEMYWTLTMITIATILHLYMIWQRNMNAFAVVAVWALIAISVANQNKNYIVYIAAIIAAVVVALNIILRLFRKRAVF